ncbi:MAG: DUF4832 domain-containing protein [Clostridiaceae bacterium]|nr:DUF4832 domain-containing protein [Clostridiaceae bacterium]
MTPVDNQHQEDLNKLHKTLGYRFVIKDFIYEDSIDVGSTLNFSAEIENKGVAPFYLKWPVIIYLKDQESSNEVFEEQNIDIRAWLPGINTIFGKFDVPNNLNPGIYEIMIGIVDPITNSPGIKFANKGNDGNNRYLLGRISIN